MGLKKTSDRTVALHLVEPRAHARDFEGLVAQLGDEDAEARRWAARDLATHEAAAAPLCARLAREVDASVRAALFASLARIGGEPVVQGLLPLLRSEDAALRNGAIEVLAGLPAAVAPSIDALLADADGDVRIFAVNLLGELRHADVPRWLGRVLLEETQVNVVGAALDLAAEVGDEAMLPALEAVRARFADEPYISFAAELAQERIRAA
ncbi:HEAT repeat domain-containing protein [Caldimonas tepidiphila]|uniref:HEAT repeat domain-containing protein n=1 Tax=Caldimonas tepidiphila TaxID=2315841 RepID=UPI000E5A942C|nr:HEAT repeat domain-containing protein [Caldimonas tepidiphila]